MRAAVRDEMAPLFDDLRRFVDRRIAELAMDVNGAVQMVDFTETNLTGQINKIQEQIGKLLLAPADETRNSGMELEAVVKTTEEAANRIMEAAEVISDWVRKGARDPEG